MHACACLYIEKVVGPLPLGPRPSYGHVSLTKDEHVVVLIVLFDDHLMLCSSKAICASSY